MNQLLYFILPLLLFFTSAVYGRDPFVEFMTPLERAIVYNEFERVKRFIEDLSMDVNAKSDDGHTPLHLAAMAKNSEITQFLLDNGADVNARDKHGTTALHWAIASENPKNAKLLIEYGADVGIRDKFNRIPFQMIKKRQASNEYSEILNLLDESEIIIEQNTTEENPLLIHLFQYLTHIYFVTRIPL